LAGLARRHQLAGLLAGQALVQLALVGLARDDNCAELASGVTEVETEVGLAFFGVGAVAGEALVRQDGADVAVEVEFAGWFGWPISVAQRGQEQSGRRQQEGDSAEGLYGHRVSSSSRAERRGGRPGRRFGG